VGGTGVCVRMQYCRDCTVEVGTSSSRDTPPEFASHLVPSSSSRRFIVVVESMTESTAESSNLGICINNSILILGKGQIDIKSDRVTIFRYFFLL